MSGGGFKGKKQANVKGLEEFRSQIEGDTTISDITRQELLTEAEGISGQSISGKKGAARFNRQLAEANKTLEEARLGQDPKFIARQQRSTRRRLVSDQPGRAQTVLTR